MYKSVKKVYPLEDYKVRIIFSGREEKIIDLKPFLKRGKYKELLDKKLFATVHVAFDTIEWDNKLDLDPEFLYNCSSN
ncbi:MAG: DUF2442 domain-containing protein [Spirochaetales bacterium]|nr:DUF2442 domain-containing protein [Spirochaetales bacterium]